MKCTLTLFNFFNNFVIKLRIEFLINSVCTYLFIRDVNFLNYKCFRKQPSALLYLSTFLVKNSNTFFMNPLKCETFSHFPRITGNTFCFTNQESEISDASRRAVRERLRLKCVKRKQVNAAAGGRFYVYAYMYMLRMQSSCIGVAQFNEVLRSARY